jgi:acetyl esterase/lipase
MKSETLYLNPTNDKVTLTTYISYDPPEIKAKPRPAMLIFPGGGYVMCSDREAEPIAKAYLYHGFNAFILRYSLNENAVFPQPLLDASAALRHIREHAAEYNIDADKIYTVGFSAGGHLAGCLATMWHEKYLITDADMKFGINKPNGAILSYAVLSPYGGPISLYDKILNKKSGDITKEEYALYSAVDHVDEKTSPIFMWHTASDNVVPIQNVILMAEKLAEQKIPFETHIYPKGPHGISLATKESWSEVPEFVNPHVSAWVDESVKWINTLN